MVLPVLLPEFIIWHATAFQASSVKVSHHHPPWSRKRGQTPIGLDRSAPRNGPKRKLSKSEMKWNEIKSRITGKSSEKFRTGVGKKAKLNSICRTTFSWNSGYSSRSSSETDITLRNEIVERRMRPIQASFTNPKCPEHCKVLESQVETNQFNRRGRLWWMNQNISCKP